MREIWKDIKGYEGIYQVSNLGNVRSVTRIIVNSRGTERKYNGKTLKQTIMKSGQYFMVPLTQHSKSRYYLVHRLVAEAFLQNTQNLPEVNHIDENKLNNNANNLEWCDRKYNYHYGTGLERLRLAIQKRICCVETGIVYNSLREASVSTGIHIGNISSCLHGKRKTAGKYHWVFM